MDWAILCQEERIEVLQIPKTLPDVFDIVISSMIGIQIDIFAICLFTRKQKSNG